MGEDKKSLPTLEATIHNFMEKRQDAAIANLYIHGDYRRYCNEHNKLFKELKEKVGFKLIDRFNEICVMLHGIETDAAYLQGLKDGMKLRELFNQKLIDIYAALYGTGEVDNNT